MRTLVRNNSKRITHPVHRRHQPLKSTNAPNMGNAQAPPVDPRFANARRNFSEQELQDLSSLFHSLAAQSQSTGHYVSRSVFQAYFQIPGPLGARMFDLATQKRHDDKLTFEDLIIIKAVYEKGSPVEMDEFIYQLVDVNGDGIVGRSDLEAVLTSVLDTMFSCQDMNAICLDAATFSNKVEGRESSMLLEDLKTWCILLPSLRKFLGCLLMSPGPGRSGYQVPLLLHSDDMNADQVILRKEHAWLIGGSLSPDQLEEWKLLYNSSTNGLSFNTFLGSISVEDGPTVLIIKDKEGYIYGGYASQNWERHSDFYGDMKSFLFQLYPQASIFRPSGANSNLQWCAVNFSSVGIPNGIGFGGQANHFGLFLSGNFDQGHSFVCSTFNSPCLSRTNNIYPEVIECWGITVKGQEERGNHVRGSVLERFKEDRHMLNLVGLANSSE